MAGFLLNTAVVRPSPVVAQNRAFKSGVELVPLTVTVTDRAGRYVPDLTAADFAVFEEGSGRPCRTSPSGDAPIDMAFLLDTSSSMRDNLPLAQKAARGLVRRLRAGDRGAVSGIGSNVPLHQSMTPDLARVDEALRSTHADGNTALYDALYIVLRQYQQERRDSTEIRRQVIVLLSDGIDTASHVTFEDLLDVVRRAEATIYVVSLANDPVRLKAVLGDRGSSESAHALNTLARESGGRLFTPRTARELSAIYDAIGQELSHQYVIGYLPSREPTGRFAASRSGCWSPASESRELAPATTRIGRAGERVILQWLDRSLTNGISVPSGCNTCTLIECVRR